ncbi:MAG: DUF4369 domain-containing protein [Bacteroidota bacterium]
MKRALFYLAAILVLSSGCKNDDNGYIISGNIENAPQTLKIFLKNDHNGIVTDSTIANNNGHFMLTGTIDYPQRHSLIYQTDEGRKEHFIWIENSAINISGTLNDIENLIIEGGKEQQLFDEQEKEQAFFYPELNRLAQENKQDSIEFLIERLSRVNRDFAVKNANNYLGIEMLYRFRQEINKDSLAHILKGLDNNILKSKYGESLVLYSNSPDLEVGNQYTDFTAKTLKGDEISASSLIKKGRPLLVIFGGLGCMQAHGREILKTFQDAYNKKIEIIAFVFARNRNEWIHDSKYPLNITLLSDMKGDHSPIKIQYDVQATPTVYIIDKDGKIAWKSLGYGNHVNEAALKLLN